MKDFIPKPADIKTRGLGPKAQKLQALRDKAAAQANSDGKSVAEASNNSTKAKALGGVKKTSFNRKAV
jgi:hypothetical protein